jgi:hypothetical protein
MNNVIITLLIETYYFWQRKQPLPSRACTTLSFKRPTAPNESTSTKPHFLACKSQHPLMNAEAHSEYVGLVMGLSAWIAKYSINVPVPSAFLAPSVSVRRIMEIGSGCALPHPSNIFIFDHILFLYRHNHTSLPLYIASSIFALIFRTSPLWSLPCC